MLRSDANTMDCPECGLTASADARFCNACGAALLQRCPSCRTPNPNGSAFCRDCGARMDASAAAAEPSPDEPGAPVGWGEPPSREPPLPMSAECPRCHAVNEAGSQFCFSCGLPFDEGRISGAQFARAGVFASGLAPVGFWARLFAYIVDGIVLSVASSIIITLSFDGTDSLGTSGASLLISAAYYTVGVSMFSTTLGKRIFNAYVLRPDGSKVGPLRALGRWLAYIPSMLVLFVGFLIVAFREDKRGWHDMICDTVVVYRRN